jgi:hypothetical protein
MKVGDGTIKEGSPTRSRMKPLKEREDNEESKDKVKDNNEASK